MSCNNFNKIENIENMLNVSLKPYQKQMLKIMECNKCNNMACDDRLADENTLDLYAQIPIARAGRRHDFYIHGLHKILKAKDRTVSPNVMR